MTPLFSVVVPVYNKEPHISRCLSSVFSQTYADFDLLVVCDPSTDNSTGEVEKFSDPRMRILYRSEPGPGGYLARNLGIEQARTKWVALLDADDEWLPDHLMRLNELAETFPDQKILSSGWEQWDGEKKFDPYTRRNAGRASHILSRADYLRAEIKSSRPICSDVACIQRDLLLAVGGFPGLDKPGRGGDVDTWFRCVMTAGSMAWSNHIGAIYHMDAVNQVTKNNAGDFRSYRKNLLLWFDKIDDPEIHTLLKHRDYTLTMVSWGGNLLIPTAPCPVFIPRIDPRLPAHLVRRGLWIGFLSLWPKRLALAIHETRLSLGRKLRRAGLLPAGKR